MKGLHTVAWQQKFQLDKWKVPSKFRNINICWQLQGSWFLYNFIEYIQPQLAQIII